LAEQIAAGNAGWPVQFRFAVHVIWSCVPELWTLDHNTSLIFMPLTNQQLFDLQVIIGRRVMEIDELLLSTIELQHGMGKYLAVKLPDMTTDERQKMQDIHMSAESNLDRLEAAVKAFRHDFERLANLK
jgi:hypothetical protein